MPYSQQPSLLHEERSRSICERKRETRAFLLLLCVLRAGFPTQLQKSLPHWCAQRLHALPRSTCTQGELFPPEDNAAPTGLSNRDLLAFLSCLCACTHTHTHTLQSGLHSNTSPSSEVPRPSAGGQAWRSAMKGGWMADGVQSAPACQGRTAPADPPGAGRQCRTCFSEALFSWLMNSWTTAR